jgi:Arabinose efflux permease
MSKSKNREGLAMLTAGLAIFMTSLDINVVNNALPAIQKDLGAGVSLVQWVIVVYLFVLCALQLVMGRLADIAGLKRVFQTGVAGFSLVSIALGFAPTIGALIALRALQATFGAMVTATGTAVLAISASPGRTGRALSATSMAVAVSTTIGPPLGGIMVRYLGWHSLFFLNAPIGLAAWILGQVGIAEDEEREKTEFDLVGSGLFIALVAAVLSLVEFAPAYRSSLPIVLAAAVAIGPLFLALARRERSAAYPLVDVELFRTGSFLAGSIASTLFFVAEFMLVFIVPYYLQEVKRYSVAASGLMLLPMSLAMIVAAPLGGIASDRLGGRIVATAGLGLMAASATSIALFRPESPEGMILVIFIVAGIGAGLFQAPNASLVMRGVPHGKKGSGGAFLNMMRNIGMLLGESGAAVALSAVGARTSAGAGPLTEGVVQRATLWIGASAAIFAIAALAFTLAARSEQDTRESTLERRLIR